MGQKINPISLRLQTTNRYFDSCWYSNFFYSNLFEQDLKIQNYLQSIFKQLKFPTSRLFLQSSQKKIQISTFFCHPLKARRVRSYYFRRKYEKIEKIRSNTLLGKNKMSNYFVNEANQLHKQRVEIRRKDLVIKGNQEKKSDLKNILYQKYFSSLYLSYPLRLAEPTTIPSTLSFSSAILIPSIKATTQNLNKRVLYCQERWMNYYSSFHCNPSFTQKWFIDFIKKKSKKKEEQKSSCFGAKQGAIRDNQTNPTLFFQSKIIKKKVKKDLFDLQKIYGKSQKKKRSLFFLNPFVDTFLENPFFVTKNRKEGVTFGSEKPVSSVTSLITNNRLLTESSDVMAYGFAKPKLAKKSGKDSNGANQSLISLKQQPTTTWISLDLYTQTPFYTDLFFNSVEKHLESSSTLKKQKLGFYKNVEIIPYQKHMETVLSVQLATTIEIDTLKTFDHFRSASFLAEEIVYYLEQRIPFRRIKNKLLKEVERLTSVKGIRITCSGRVGGRSKKAQRAKIDLVKFGETSLHVFSSRIDFASKKALTSFGLMGIKVWISYTN